MKIFHFLKGLTAFRRQRLPFLTTLEDVDIVREIGFQQEAGDPITLKVLFLQNVGSVATVQRRLSRLKQLGVVHQSRAPHDKRLVKLTLNSTIFRDYRKMYAQLTTHKAPPAKAGRSTGAARGRARA